MLLTSKKYKKKLLKCYELLDKIMASLATFETLISLSLDDGTVIDAKEFQVQKETYKYALNIVDVASQYKGSYQLTTKNSKEVASSLSVDI